MSDYSKGLQGVVAGESKIGLVDGTQGVLAYLGYPIQVLAQYSTYEETAFLLLNGRLPKKKELSAFEEKLKKYRALPSEALEVIELLPSETHPMEALQTVVSLLGSFSKVTDLKEKSIELIAQFPTIVAHCWCMKHKKEVTLPHEDLSHAANFLYMLHGEEPAPDVARMFDICLILHAEHSFNASTFTARVVASTLTTLHASISAAIGALYGPLHGGANEKVLDMISDVASEKQVNEWVSEKMDRKEKIMGMGHRVYKVKDPRSYILEEMLKTLSTKLKNMTTYKILKEIETVVRKEMEKQGKDIWPNVDFFSGALYELMGISRELFTPVFAISRISGWCAHVLEQLEDNRIYRPACQYVGARNVAYKPIETR
ncbi:MAG: citrate/2-methylcitrate synthase [Deltaproteobacteria bacterium]|nr:citrate/2-methylcitrate synthase [Deltaproteobacteria bacterium]